MNIDISCIFRFIVDVFSIFGSIAAIVSAVCLYSMLNIKGDNNSTVLQANKGKNNTNIVEHTEE